MSDAALQRRRATCRAFTARSTSRPVPFVIEREPAAGG
jgi:hypothetical protein